MSDRSDRQHWGEGDVQYTPSQCSNCIYNKSADECEIFGNKPQQYQFGTSVCTNKKVSNEA